MVVFVTNVDSSLYKDESTFSSLHRNHVNIATFSKPKHFIIFFDRDSSTFSSLYKNIYTSSLAKAFYHIP